MKSFSWRRIVVFVVLFEFQGKAGFDSNCVSSEGDFVPQWIRVPAILSRRWKDCNLVCKRGEKLANHLANFSLTSRYSSVFRNGSQKQRV